MVTGDKDEARKGGKSSSAKSVASGASGSKSKESKKEEKVAEKGTLAQRRAQVLSLLALLTGTKVLYWYKSRRWRRTGTKGQILTQLGAQCFALIENARKNAVREEKERERISRKNAAREEKERERQKQREKEQENGAPG